MNEEMKPDKEVLRLNLILKRAWELAWDIAIRTMTIEEAKEEAWMKVAGSVKLMIESRPEPRQGVDEKELAQFILDKFYYCTVYNGLEKTMSKAILSRFTLPAEVEWPKEKKHYPSPDFDPLGESKRMEKFDLGWVEGFNQSHAEWTAYLNDLLRPLEWLLERYPLDEMIKGERSHTIMKEIQSVLLKHKAGTGEGEVWKR